MHHPLRRLVQWFAIAAIAFVLIALLPTPNGWVPKTDTDEPRQKRYLVTIPANSVVNFTGWTQTYVPLGLALFGRQPYVLNFG